MARSTNLPVATAQMRKLGVRIVEAVVQHGGEVVGQAALAELTGLTRRQINKVAWVGAVIASEELNAALVVRRRGDGAHYILTKDPALILDTLWATIRVVATKGVRSAANLNPIESTGNIGVVAMAGSLRTMLAALAGLDAVYAATHAPTTPEPAAA